MMPALPNTSDGHPEREAPSTRRPLATVLGIVGMLGGGLPYLGRSRLTARCSKCEAPCRPRKSKLCDECFRAPR